MKFLKWACSTLTRLVDRARARTTGRCCTLRRAAGPMEHNTVAITAGIYQQVLGRPHLEAPHKAAARLLGSDAVEDDQAMSNAKESEQGEAQKSKQGMG